MKKVRAKGRIEQHDLNKGLEFFTGEDETRNLNTTRKGRGKILGLFNSSARDVKIRYLPSLSFSLKDLEPEDAKET